MYLFWISCIDRIATGGKAEEYWLGQSPTCLPLIQNPPRYSMDRPSHTSNSRRSLMEGVRYSQSRISGLARGYMQRKHLSHMLSTRTIEKKFVPTVSHILRAIMHRPPSDPLENGRSSQLEQVRLLHRSAAMFAKTAGKATRYLAC